MTLIDSLVSYWKLDEASGNAADSVGSNTLTNTNTVTYSAGKINNGANFVKASSQKLSITDAAQTGLDITGDLSISCWAKFASSAAQAGLVSKSLDSSNNRCWELQFRTTNTLAMTASSRGDYAAGAGMTYCTAPFTPTSGTWYHIVMIFKASDGSVLIYVNNSSQTITYTFQNARALYNSAEDFKLGFDGQGSYLDGSLDEVGIWSRALSAAEVTELYNGGAGFAYPFAPLFSRAPTMFNVF